MTEAEFRLACFQAVTAANPQKVAWGHDIRPLVDELYAWTTRRSDTLVPEVVSGPDMAVLSPSEIERAFRDIRK